MYSARIGPIEHMAEEAALNRSGASRHDRSISDGHGVDYASRLESIGRVEA